LGGRCVWSSLALASASREREGIFVKLSELSLQADLDPYLRKVIEVASAEDGVAEDPALGANRGSRIDEYLRSVHVDPGANSPIGYAWATSFVYWCFRQAALVLGVKCPCVRTASAVAHWDFTRAPKVLAVDARLDHGKVKPGMIFCRTHDRTSRMGIVCAVTEDGLVTAEGSALLSSDRDGGAVVFGKTRSWSYVQCGFINYAGMAAPLEPPLEDDFEGT